MSCDVKAAGRLRFRSGEEIDEVYVGLEGAKDEEGEDEEEDDAVDEVLQVVRSGIMRDGVTLTVRIDVSLTATANMILQDFLDDLATTAIEGQVDVWFEFLDDGIFIRLHAGGEEETISGTFPEPG
jgi:hypothetical protein